MPSRLAALGFAGLLWTPLLASAQTAPSLGSAASFAVLGGSAVTDSGSSVVTGNLGVSPGNTISGFAVDAVRIGSIHRDDALARQAQKDNAAAYKDLAAQTCAPFSGTTLEPGVYCLTSPLTGVLTLDAADDPHAVWIFRGPALTATANAAVRVVNSGYEGNVFWQVSGSAALGAGAAFVGNILALTNITIDEGASLSGRALSQTGAVKLNNNRVSLCCDPNLPVDLTPSTLPKGLVGTMFSATFIASGGMPPYTYAFSEGIPPGLKPGLTPADNTLSGKPTQAGSYHFFVTATDSRGCHGTRGYTIDVVCGEIVIDPPELPKTCAVDQVITASGGTGTYEFSAPGLPNGVILVVTPGTATAVLSGMPLTPGCYPVTVTARDAFCAGSRTYTICNIGIVPAALPSGGVGTPYPTTTITAVGGTPPYTCSISGLLPTGLSQTGCEIIGTPMVAGCFTFTETVTDALGFTCSRTYTICIGPCPAIISFPLPPDAPGGCSCSDKAIVIQPGSLPPAHAGVLYSETIVASGGESPYRFAISGPSPCNLSVVATSDTSAKISGKPLAGCSTSPFNGAAAAVFTVTATDNAGCTGSQAYRVEVTCPSITLTPAALPGGNVSAPYSQTITATGGAAPYTFTLVDGALPSGLTLHPGGALSGTPTTVGTYCFTVGARDSGGCLGSAKSYTIVISASTCPGGTVIALSPPFLPFAATGAPYSQLITATGGTAPYTFAVTSGALPPNLTLNPVTGLVSGTPIASGVYKLTIGATDANGCFGSMGCEVVMTVDIPATSSWGMVLLVTMLALVGVATIKGGV